METRDLWVFIAGFLSCALILYGFIYTTPEIPFNPTGFVTALNNNNKLETPHDRIRYNDIIVHDDSIILNIKGASISNYAPTGSMKPLLDTGTNGIRIQPQNEEDIAIGDIISFKQEGILKVHRVIGTGKDKQGTYYITQGDNTNINDGKIRYEQIEYLTIGILW